MDVVLVTDVCFWRRSLGSEERIFQLLEIFRNKFDISVFFTGKESSLDRDALDIPVFIYSDFNGDRDITSGAIKFNFNKEVASCFSDFCQKYTPKIGIYEYISLAYLSTIEGAPKRRMIDTHDIMHRREKTFKIFFKTHHLSLAASEELTILDTFDAILAIQIEDYRYLQRILGAGRVILAPLTVDAVFSRDYHKRTESIIFVGGMSPMNADGLRWFVRQVWPFFSNEGVSLHIFGEVGRILNEREFDIRNIVVHGKVNRADLNRGYMNADIAINPVYFGGGLKIKTIEALSFGVPVIGTAEAFRGVVRDRNWKPYLCARSRAEFVEMLKKTIDLEDFRLSLSNSAAPFIQKYYSKLELRSVVQTLTEMMA